jgi:hypothetical protein
MKIHVQWGRPIDIRGKGIAGTLDLRKLPLVSGVYIFGRRRRRGFEVAYIGRAENIRKRIKKQLNNLRLMQHLQNARGGRRLLLVGRFASRPGQQPAKSLVLLERALIRHFLSEGHDLVNKQGTRLRRHEIKSRGKYSRKFIPPLIYLDR